MQTFSVSKLVNVYILYRIQSLAYAIGENNFGECGYQSNKQSVGERNTFTQIQGLVNPVKQVRLVKLSRHSNNIV